MPTIPWLWIPTGKDCCECAPGSTVCADCLGDPPPYVKLEINGFSGGTCCHVDDLNLTRHLRLEITTDGIGRVICTWISGLCSRCGYGGYRVNVTYDTETDTTTIEAILSHGSATRTLRYTKEEEGRIRCDEWDGVTLTWDGLVTPPYGMTVPNTITLSVSTEEEYLAQTPMWYDCAPCGADIEMPAEYLVETFGFTPGPGAQCYDLNDSWVLPTYECCKYNNYAYPQPYPFVGITFGTDLYGTYSWTKFQLGSSSFYGGFYGYWGVLNGPCNLGCASYSHFVVPITDSNLGSYACNYSNAWAELTAL